MRMKNRWNKKAKPQTLEDIAQALGFICWQITANGVLELENRGFHTATNYHRLQIVGEYLAFLLQVADRLCYEQFDESQRARFILSLARKMADTFADNQSELLQTESAAYRQDFITLLNQRASEYAEFAWVDDAPNFSFLRYFGEKMAAVLPGEKSLWISQYFSEHEALEGVIHLKRALKGLLEKGFTEATISTVE
ncbi:MAG: hypothetical protein R3E08_04640 [Thiotrichaceae bacterium]